MKYKYLFGPVHSRRFGKSLGIDVSPDTKSCNFDCLYCELKAATPITHIENPPQVEDIVNEVLYALEEFSDIDVITITSNGEPTLYSDLETLVLKLNDIKQNRKLLILSNAATITDKRVQKSLQHIDIVKLSLDCATQTCFEKIDRPAKGIYIDAIISAMVDFQQTFTHDLIIEVLLVAGVNDKKEELIHINHALKRIKPIRIDIGTIDRPPAYGVMPVTQEALHSLSTYITQTPITIPSHMHVQEQSVELDETELIALLKRRPQSQYDIKSFTLQTQSVLKRLLKEQVVYKKDIAGVDFFAIIDQKKDKK